LTVSRPAPTSRGSRGACTKLLSVRSRMPRFTSSAVGRSFTGQQGNGGKRPKLAGVKVPAHHDREKASIIGYAGRHDGRNTTKHGPAYRLSQGTAGAAFPHYIFLLRRKSALMFLGLAVFLFLRADPENWPLGPNASGQAFVRGCVQHRARCC